MFSNSPQVQEYLQNEWVDIVSSHFPLLSRKRELKPVIQFMDSANILGQWLGFPLNTITLNANLLKRPWYVLLDVFRHEVAHQLTDLLHPNSEQPPHGQDFRDICALIGANPAATTEQIPLDDRVFGDAAPEDSITSKIQKLLNLAESASDNEAEVALCKAHEIMAKHGISEPSLSTPMYVTISIGEPVRQISSEMKLLSALLHRFWPVEIIWAPEPDPHDPKRHLFSLFLSGTPENVRLAAYVHDFILNHIRQEFTMRYATRGLPKRMMKSFALGVVNGLYEALERQTNSSQEYALVLQKDARLEEYYHSRFAHTRKTGGSQSIGDMAAFKEGLSYGARLTIAPGIDPHPKKELTQ